MASSRESILSWLASSALKPLPGARAPDSAGETGAGAGGFWAKALKDAVLAMTRAALNHRVVSERLMMVSSLSQVGSTSGWHLYSGSLINRMPDLTTRRRARP